MRLIGITAKLYKVSIQGKYVVNIGYKSIEKFKLDCFRELFQRSKTPINILQQSQGSIILLRLKDGTEFMVILGGNLRIWITKLRSEA